VVLTQDISIRYFKLEDYPDIVRLSKICISKVIPNEEFEEDKIEGLFKLALTNVDFTGISLVIDGKVRGYILGYTSSHYFHSKKMAYCMSIYVEEEYRKYGLEMIKSFEAWGRYKGAKTLTISTFTNLSPKGLGSVYKRQGFIEKEVVYWKEL
jgi:hypothetical protein